MKTATTVAIATLAFVAGVFASRQLPTAAAQTTAAVPLVAQVIDVDALEGAAIGPIAPTTELRSKLLVLTDQASVSVQQGNVNKHYHAGNEEIQYIIAGAGTIWLGDQQRAIKAGDLIVIPKGTPHAGTVATSGTFKALVVKIPPQAPGDVKFVP